MYKSLKDSIVNNECKMAIHNPHTQEPVIITDKIVNAVFIDPGIKTCAICSVENNFNTNTITTKMLKLFDFRVKTVDENDFSTDGTACYTKCIEILEENMEFFLNAHYIVMEFQGSWASPNTIRIAQHLITFFLISLKDRGNRPLIIEIDPKLKSTMLGLKKMKQTELKKTCKQIAIQFLKDRGENQYALILEGKGKKDDLGDTICYEHIWWNLLKTHSVKLHADKLEKKKLKIVIL